MVISNFHTIKKPLTHHIPKRLEAVSGNFVMVCCMICTLSFKLYVLLKISCIKMWNQIMYLTCFHSANLISEYNELRNVCILDVYGMTEFNTYTIIETPTCSPACITLSIFLTSYLFISRYLTLYHIHFAISLFATVLLLLLLLSHFPLPLSLTSMLIWNVHWR